MDLKVEFEKRVSVLEVKTADLEKSIVDLRADLKSLSRKVDDLKKWIVGSIVGGLLLTTVLTWILKFIAGG
jgi:predicted  nucleic acid-binding Zn-ribbon protein